MKRIVLIEDHQLFADGIANILAKAADLSLVAHFLDAESALPRMGGIRPDLILVDLALPGINGFEAARRMRQRLPDMPIMVLSMYGGRALIRTAISLDLNGYLLKSGRQADFLTGIRTVLQGERYYSPGLTEGLL